MRFFGGKYLIVSLLYVSTLFMGCPEGSYTVNRCYLSSGLYLVNGDCWDPTGDIEEVFYAYNTDPELSVLFVEEPAGDELHAYQDAGFRVVLYYPGEHGNHTRPMGRHEQIDFYIYGAYVAGNFDWSDQ